MLTYQKKTYDIRRDSPRRIMLRDEINIRIPLTKTVKIVSLVIIISAFVLGPAIAPKALQDISSAQEDASSTAATTDSGRDLQGERAALENQLSDLEAQIDAHQKTIENYQKQGKTLNTEIKTLNTKIEKLNLQIKSVNLNLTKLNQEIADTQKQINRTENNIDTHKEAISKSLRNLYEADQQSLAITLLANNKLSDFFGDLANITLVQNNLRVSLAEIVRLRQELLSEKEQLSTQKEDTESLKAIQESQKRSVQATQTEKSNLLKVTKGKEAEYQKLLAKTKETAAQIRSQIFQLLGGGELTFEKAYDYARLAEGATGVRAALILAILNRESLLGKNTGRCAYNQIMRGGTTAMSPRETPIFLDILQRLSIDPNSIVAQISCPNSDGTYGGAMGPAQFIPSTWKKFESQISTITNNTPPNPWNNSDAFAATALYLKNIGANSQIASAEKRAAAMYYCGGNWQRYACSIYASRVMESATTFQKDINILNGA